MRSLVLLLLMAVHLPAYSQCTILPYSIPPDSCNSTSCSPAFRTYFIWQPTIYVSCGDREYLTVTVNVDYEYLSHYPSFQGDSLDEVVERINDFYYQQIRLYAEDQYGDMSLAGTGDFKNKSSMNFTVHGSTNYMFTFDQSLISGFTLATSPLPYCEINLGQNKILKADDANSAQYQCSLFVDSVDDSIELTKGLNGCTHHSCQYFADRKTVAFCESIYSGDECYQKAKYVWFIGTEFDLSSLPKIIIYCFLILLYFVGLGHGLRT